MNTHSRRCLSALLASLLFLAGCGNGDRVDHEDPSAASGREVATTGKEDTAVEAVPEAVIQAARSARPELQIAASEHEVRDGNEYYDLAGTLPDGTELELDLTRIDGVWTVVEVQRDILLDAVPGAVQQALAEQNPAWSPERIIESDQGDGVVIYEFFGPGEGGEEMKVEVKWEGGAAEELRDEWVH